MEKEATIIKCLSKIRAIVRNFTDQYYANQNAPDLSELELRISYDIFLSHMEQILTILQIAIADAAIDINNETDILNINHWIKNVFTGKQITKFKNSDNIIVSKNREVSR